MINKYNESIRCLARHTLDATLAQLFAEFDDTIYCIIIICCFCSPCVVVVIIVVSIVVVIVFAAGFPRISILFTCQI